MQASSNIFAPSQDMLWQAAGCDVFAQDVVDLWGAQRVPCLHNFLHRLHICLPAGDFIAENQQPAQSSSTSHKGVPSWACTPFPDRKEISFADGVLQQAYMPCQEEIYRATEGRDPFMVLLTSTQSCQWPSCPQSSDLL
jgi:hypothetical protein